MIESFRSMTTKPSKTQIDGLGDRLRKGPLTQEALELLDEYRRSFGPAYESVVQSIREHTKVEPSGRPAKSTGAIIEKLRRESIRLTQVQDIAGCRVVVRDISEQGRVVALLRTIFPEAIVVDRRAKPTHGYRAVHIIPRIDASLVEIQVRSRMQHLWAEPSERFSDVVDPAIEYGGGPPHVRELLARTSAVIEGFEKIEESLVRIRDMRAKARRMLAKRSFDQRRKTRRDPEYTANQKKIAGKIAQLTRATTESRKLYFSARKQVVELLNQLIAADPLFESPR